MNKENDTIDKLVNTVFAGGVGVVTGMVLSYLWPTTIPELIEVADNGQIDDWEKYVFMGTALNMYLANTIGHIANLVQDPTDPVNYVPIATNLAGYGTKKLFDRISELEQEHGESLGSNPIAKLYELSTRKVNLDYHN